ncbi:MAG: zf-TFIIB domain-containing protein [Dehalococcoidia bacterium]
MTLTCPRDGAQLQAATDHAVPYQRCPTCKGGWFDLHEFEELEATAADSDAVAGTIEYAERESTLKCPSCGKPLAAFDYRGENLELDACDAEHGFWLDAGAAERVRVRMRERVQDLKRAATAERSWNAERARGFQRTLIERLRNIFSGK